jgi:hypothetical protein
VVADGPATALGYATATFFGVVGAGRQGFTVSNS